MTKELADYWADWEGQVFGRGYGSGEPHVVPALRAFFDAVPAEGNYDHEKIGAAVGAVPAWLLINTLCHARIIEYGTSPRFGWLTKTGRELRKFMLEHSADDLLQMLDKDEDYPSCYPDACNCGSDGYDAARKCANPFW